VDVVGSGGNVPSVMIITVDMQHLVLLDTQYTVCLLASMSSVDKLWSSRTQTTHTQLILFKLLANCFPAPLCGVESDIVPVPRTTTSYSGAISSILILYPQQKKCMKKVESVETW
jgi:hypothetical protein